MAMRCLHVGTVVLMFAGLTVAQSSSPQNPPPQNQPAKNPSQAQSPSVSELPPSEAPPRSDDASDDRNFSSSRENITDLSPPKDDLKDHPDSAAALARADQEDKAESAAAEVQEFHQWNPMKALKDVEVGDYYFKKKNYRGALDRYKEALFYKENDAVATFRLAVCEEKMGDKPSALTHYAAYLKILPHGPFADEARDSIQRLGGELPETKASETKETAAQK